MDALRCGLAISALAIGACSGPAAASCPRDLPPSCPDAGAPSYASTVAPLIQSRCYPCHATGGVEGTTHNLTTWAKVYSQRTAVLDQVYACLMPLSTAPPLSDAQRVDFLTWLVCGAPNN